MKYLSFNIKNYRAINNLTISLESKLLPLVGVNECGKTTILQAIYSFDYTNDEEYAGRHLKSIQNLYDTVNKVALVTSTVSLKVQNVVEVLNDISIQLTNGTLKLLPDEPVFEYNREEVQKKLGRQEKDLVIEITRNLNDKTYSSNLSLRLPEILSSKTIDQQFAKGIVLRLPYILYNDDFADRPPSEIQIPTPRPKVLSGWLAIYERLFRQTDPNYSIFSLISESDSRRRASILSDVEAQLNSTLSTAWKNFSVDKKNVVNVSLTLSEGDEKRLLVGIVEQLNNKNRYFDILDRSKGFVWYFNFIMKTQFNPKIAGKVEDTIFLLDEPGSYLHSSAQDKLSAKLKEISQNFGIVIYCTHSHHLLNPSEIPLKNIFIVEKSRSKSISLIEIDRYKSRSEKINALQPVYEALELPLVEFFSDPLRLLLVEGINDKYILEMLVDNSIGFRILPGTSADSILKNIPYMIAYDKKFFCLWDNDEEGLLNQKRARKNFGIDEALLLVLPLENRLKRRMEDMIADSDYTYLRNKLSLDLSASYDLIIPSLYFTERKKRTKICEGLSPQTKSSFAIVGRIISTALSKLGDDIAS